MCEEYKGYSINVIWNDKTMGFDFRVCDAGGAEIGRNELSFFYAENALAAARTVADKRLESGDGEL